MTLSHIRRDLVVASKIDFPEFLQRRTKIGIHDGNFHCAEVLACVLLKHMPEYYEAVIVRTQNETVLNSCEIVVGVGGMYNVKDKRFDHTQWSFHKSMHSLNAAYPWNTPLSSAGLIYFYYGRKILANILRTYESNPEVKSIFYKLYENFIEEIDAVSNGININDILIRYKVTTDLNNRVKYLNPAWNYKYDFEALTVNVQALFAQAFKMVENEFIQRVVYYRDVWYPAIYVVRDAVRARYRVHDSGAIIKLPIHCCPWKDHLMAVEEEFSIQGDIKFVLYLDTSRVWMIHAVPVHPRSFTFRVPFKREWWGLSDQLLSQVSGIDGCTFVHRGGFIAGNTEMPNAICMAALSMPAAE